MSQSIGIVEPFPKEYLPSSRGLFLLEISMDKLEYNCDLLRTIREKKKITAQSIAFDLCLSERHIKSIEENSPRYFPSLSTRISSVKKYALALGLKLEDVFENNAEILYELTVKAAQEARQNSHNTW